MTRTVLRQVVTAATGSGALVAVENAQVAVTRASDGGSPVVWTDPTAGTTIPAATLLTADNGLFECWLDAAETDLIFNFTVTALTNTLAAGTTNRRVSFPTYTEEVDVRSGPSGPTGPPGPGGGSGYNVVTEGAVGNGTTDDRAAFATTDGFASQVTVPKGTYRIASNLTISGMVEMVDGAVIKPDSGVTVTLAGGVRAGPYKAFDHSAGGTVLVKAMDRILPEWWGAKGDGSNSTVAVNAAYLSAGTGAGFTAPGTGGCQVYFGAGDYRFDNVTAPSNVDTVGAGKGATRIRPTVATSSTFVLRPASYSTVRDIYFDGDAQNVILVEVYQAARVMLHRLYLTNTTGDGIKFTGASGHTAHANKVVDCYLLSCGGVGIHTNDGFTYDQEILQVWIGSCGTGISLNAGANMITNAHVWGSTGDGVFLAPASQTVLNNCYLESNAGYGLNNGSGGRGNALVGSRVWNNSTGGVYVNASNDFRCTGTLIYENHGPGMLIASALYTVVTGCSFYDNQAPQTQTYAITSTGSADFSTIIGNVLPIQRHLTGSLNLVGSHNSITGNVADTGNSDTALTFPSAGVDVGAAVNGAAGQNRNFTFKSSGVARWLLRCNNTTESGSNAGSDLTLLSRTDAGGALSTVLSITRSSGQITIGDACNIAVGTTTGTKIGTSSSQKIGFYGSTPVAKQTVTGSKGGNAALASLLTTLATLGIITDSST